MIRTSIAVFLLRIATVKAHRRIIYGNITCIWLLTVIYLFIMIYQCSPPSYFYEQILPGHSGVCPDKNRVPRATIAHSIISALTDFILALLPIAILWDVKLNKRTKATIATLLGLGVLYAIASLASRKHPFPLPAPSNLPDRARTAPDASAAPELP